VHELPILEWLNQMDILSAGQMAKNCLADRGVLVDGPYNIHIVPAIGKFCNGGAYTQ
jgi:hypothetical protein